MYCGLPIIYTLCDRSWHAIRKKHPKPLCLKWSKVSFRSQFKGIAPVTQNHLRHFVTYVGMSESATHATRNEVTTSFETVKNEKVCSFLHGHGNLTTKQDKVATCRKLKRAFIRDVLKFRFRSYPSFPTDPKIWDFKLIKNLHTTMPLKYLLLTI